MHFRRENARAILDNIWGVSIHVSLNHVTHYRYDRRSALSPQLVRLRPAPHCRTPILAYSLKVVPKEHFVNWQQDPQSNYLARLAFPEPVHEFRIEVDLIADLAVFNPFDFFLEPQAENFPFAYENWLATSCAVSPQVPLRRRTSRAISRASRAHRDRTSISWSDDQPWLQRHRLLDSARAGRTNPEKTLPAGRARAAIPPGCWCK